MFESQAVINAYYMFYKIDAYISIYLYTCMKYLSIYLSTYPYIYIYTHLQYGFCLEGCSITKYIGGKSKISTQARDEEMLLKFHALTHISDKYIYIYI